MDAKSRTGKELHDFKLSELIEEYAKVNSEGEKVVTSAIELGVLEIKRSEIEIKLKEYSSYQSEIAREFIQRFI